MTDEKIAKAGTLLQVDHGAYSDYGVFGFFVVLRDFDPLAKRDEYLEANPEQRPRYGFSQYKFMAYLIQGGFLLEIEPSELYLTDYGDASEMTFTPR